MYWCRIEFCTYWSAAAARASEWVPLAQSITRMQCERAALRIILVTLLQRASFLDCVTAKSKIAGTVSSPPDIEPREAVVITIH